MSVIMPDSTTSTTTHTGFVANPTGFPATA